MQKRGQAAMEFLMTYGWAVLISLIALSALGYYITLPSKVCTQNFQLSDNIVAVVDQKFAGSDSTVPESQNKFYMVIRNNLPRPATIDGIILVKKGGVNCGSFPIPDEIELEGGERSNLLQGSIDNVQCQGKVGDCYHFDVELSYTSSTGITHTSTGYVEGTYEDVTERWKVGDWKTTKYDYGGGKYNLTKIVSGKEKIGYCGPDTPPDLSAYTLIWTNTYKLEWKEIFGGSSVPLQRKCSDYYNSKYNMPLHQGGFTNVSTCLEIPTNLTKGWIHTTMYIDPLFANTDVYLGGDGTCTDSKGRARTDCICVDDNLYFYINGQRKAYGGTTGLVGDKDNVLEGNEEVLTGCGNCVSTGTWCIPAFKITSAGFNFGQENNIDILVEDFCTGGGLSPLKLSIV